MKAVPDPNSADPPAQEAEKPSSRRALNATAYRIFKLLQWLIATPLSVDELNQRFKQEPLIGKEVSTDSIWLYINTLKALGCNISRPGPKNGFRYEMIRHPFGLNLTSLQLDMLAQAKMKAQHHFTHQEMLALDGLLKKIVSHSEAQNTPELVERLFEQSRSHDFEDCREHLDLLEHASNEEELLEIEYMSPVKGEERFSFLPEALFYRQGVVYVRGERPEYEDPSTLRVDRVLSLKKVTDPALKSTLQARQSQKQEVVLHILVDTPQLFQGFSLDPYQGVYQETRMWVDAAEPYYEVRLLVRDVFFLKQVLLSSGLPFRVCAPTVFREEVVKTLRSMCDFYREKDGGAYGNG